MREVVHEFKNEEPRECAAQIGDSGEEGHVRATDVRVGDFGVEGTDGHEHDGGHESAEDVFHDDEQEIRSAIGKNC